jgi:hypothetical protein
MPPRPPLHRPLVVAIASLLALGAGAGACLTPPRTPSTGLDAGHPCDAVAGYATTLIVDWPRSEAVDLDVITHEGLAVVAYDCNGIHLVKGCHVEGAYAYAGVERQEQKLLLTTADEIRAYLPRSGERLAQEVAPELAGGGGLELRIVTVGRRTASIQSVREEHLSGACATATHLVRRVAIGAFEMSRANASARTTDGQRSIARDGDYASCARSETGATPTRGCDAAVLLDLAPIARGGRRSGPAPAPTASGTRDGG